MMFRYKARGNLMPSLQKFYDTQCAFKGIDADGLKELVPKAATHHSLVAEPPSGRRALEAVLRRIRGDAILKQRM